MSPIAAFPPLDCSMLFYDLVNFHTRNNPTLPMLAYADEQASDHPITEITFLEFGRAAHRIAHALRPGRAGDEGQVVVLIANCDTILFHAVVAGMFMAGLVPFLVSPRNSAAAVVNMMEKTNCSRIMTLFHAHDDLIESIRKENSNCELKVNELPMMSYAFPKLGHEVEADYFEPYPGPVSRPDIDLPAIYFHSSGSTGFPKPIPHSHRFQAHHCAQPMMETIKNLPISTRIGVMGLPPFHGYGTICQAAPVIPTTDNMLDCVRWTECRVVFTVPTFLEQWAVSRENVQTLKKLDWVAFGGAPLSEKIGDELCAAGVALTSLYAGTEFGCPVYLRTDVLKERDWNWVRFSEDINIRWVPYGDDTYECQVLASDNYPVAVVNLPDAKGYATSDLWVKHPTKDLWKIVGRADDVITLASGEKAVPAPMEGVIDSSPFVNGTLMFGRGRNQVGVLVEPHAEHVVDIRDDDAVAEFRNKIWLVVDEANMTAPAFSRIFKEMILITTPGKPILRTPKGSIQKKATIVAYGAEIDALYDVVESTSQFDGFTPPSVWTAATLESWLTELANAISRGHSLSARTDLFAQGFDSLSVTYLRNKILNALRTSPDPKLRSSISRISQNIVFENPTIELLAARLASLVDTSGTSQDLDPKQQHVAAINDMIQRYTVGLPKPPPSVNGAIQNRTCPAQLVVLLTGSTGGLGSFLLAQLIQNPGVGKVYAFNRPSSTSSIERQKTTFIDKGLTLDLLESDKVVYIEADATQDKCGLSPALYEELRDTVTTIIHNAWRLDFNLSLSSFEPNVRATRNLVELGLDSRHRSSLRFVFTSSVGCAQSWDHERGPYPEEVQLDPSWSVGGGYGEAKYVCERIIVKSGLRGTVLRIGQIAGGPNGSWATTDWVPIIVKSSIALGAFPNSRGVVSWMHAEEVAGSVLDIAFVDDAPEAVNIVNPQRPPWTEIMSSIRDAVVERRQGPLTNDGLPIVPFADWIAQLEERADSATPEDLVNIPAIKLLEFFRGMMRHEVARSEAQVWEAGVGDFNVAKAQRVSKTLAHMRPVGHAEARAWVNYWSSVGLF